MRLSGTQKQLGRCLLNRATTRTANRTALRGIFLLREIAMLLALLVSVLQPVTVMQQVSQPVEQGFLTTAFCGGPHDQSAPHDSDQGGMICKACSVCCAGQALISAAPLLLTLTWCAWRPTLLERAAPVRGPPVVQLRARAPPAFS